MMRHKYVFVLTILVALWLGAVMPLPADDDADYYARLKRSWRYMERVYEQLNQRYVEELDPYPLMRAAINGMLGELDPYTVFLEKEGERNLRVITTGKYGGLGMEVGLRGKKVTVIAPIDDSPAKKMGIQAGDVIEKVDGQSVEGWSISKVSGKLRGKVGTKVTLLIRRPGLSEPFEVTLTRAEIVIKDVGYAGFAAPGIGYIDLTGFTDKAPKEVRQAILNLQKEQELKGFILDLRSNPGGLLESAVKIVNLFVPKGRLVVSTRGYREKEYKFFTTQEPLLPDVPLVVLVNNGSASASEIVAGALQDMDRAVIVGQPTFGKGLVQKVFTIDKKRNIKLKITTAKYYIPSGRCIQKKDYALNSDAIIPDSTAGDADSVHLFFTLGHRPVYDRGGIYPDVKVLPDSMSYVLLQLIRKHLIFDFAVRFLNSHPDWDPETLDENEMMTEFHDYLKEKNFDYTLECGKELDKIKTLVSKKGYDGQVNELLKQLETALHQQKLKDLKKHEDQIKTYLVLELIEKKKGKADRIRYGLQSDPQAQKAIWILENGGEYRQILSGK